MGESKTAVINKTVNVEPGTFLMEFEGAELLNKFDLPVAKSTLAATKEQAEKIAEEIGYPMY